MGRPHVIHDIPYVPTVGREADLPNRPQERVGVRLRTSDSLSSETENTFLLSETVVEGDDAVKIGKKAKSFQRQFCFKPGPATGNAEPELLLKRG